MNAFIQERNPIAALIVLRNLLSKLLRQGMNAFIQERSCIAALFVFRLFINQVARRCMSACTKKFSQFSNKAKHENRIHTWEKV